MENVGYIPEEEQGRDVERMKEKIIGGRRLYLRTDYGRAITSDVA